MARKIIILDKGDKKSFFDVNCVFWLDVPLAKQSMSANPNATSIVQDITAGELANIKNGTILEKVFIVPFANATTINAIGANLISKYNAEQVMLNNDTHLSYFGTFWDGTSWTVKGA